MHLMGLGLLGVLATAAALGQDGIIGIVDSILMEHPPARPPASPQSPHRAAVDLLYRTIIVVYLILIMAICCAFGALPLPLWALHFVFAIWLASQCPDQAQSQR